MSSVDQHLAQRLFVSTYTGRQFYPLAPTPEQIDIEDIAHGLAYQCRFNGQTRHFYSVAQHSLIVAELVPTDLRLAALLHDAAEAYMGDMVKPLKQLFPLFSEIEAKVMGAIGLRYGVTHFDDKAIKSADLIALATEKRDLMPNSSEAWDSLTGIVASPVRIRPMSPQQAKAAFLSVFRETDQHVSSLSNPRLERKPDGQGEP